MAATFDIPGFGLRWKTTSMTVGPQGDVAYGRDGKLVVFQGKAATVWRKRTDDGSWECVVDIWNDDGPEKPRRPVMRAGDSGGAPQGLAHGVLSSSNAP